MLPIMKTEDNDVYRSICFEHGCYYSITLHALHHTLIHTIVIWYTVRTVGKKYHVAYTAWTFVGGLTSSTFRCQCKQFNVTLNSCKGICEVFWVVVIVMTKGGLIYRRMFWPWKSPSATILLNIPHRHIFAAVTWAIITSCKKCTYVRTYARTYLLFNLITQIPSVSHIWLLAELQVQQWSISWTALTMLWCNWLPDMRWSALEYQW